MTFFSDTFLDPLLDTQPADHDGESCPEKTLSNVHWIHQKLSAAFPQADITVTDTRGDDQHLSVTVISGVFTEKSRITCHQMVYAALDNMRHNQIHALALRTQVKSLTGSADAAG
ncbi:MAG: BolA family transcriptional regulator [Alphaproteobacteria bacterium]|nr:BolA family transcriptional regulator [Alphaproteobacteria bacterium]